MRLRGRLAPGGGASECRPTRSSAIGSLSTTAAHVDQVGDGADHALHRRAIRALDRAADTAQPESAERLTLAVVRARRTAALGDLKCRQAHCSSPAATGSAPA